MMDLLHLIRVIILFHGYTTAFAKRHEEGRGFYPDGGSFSNQYSIQGAQDTSNYKINGENSKMRRQIPPTSSSCNIPPPRIPNSISERINNYMVIVTCLENYQTQLNTTVIEIECQDGQWRILAVPDDFTQGGLRCFPHCDPPCTRGECVARETSTYCRCPGLYSGATCEIPGCLRRPNVFQAEVLWQDMQREQWTLGSPGVSGSEVLAVCDEGATFNISSVNKFLKNTPHPNEMLFRCDAGVWQAKVPGKEFYVDFEVAECEYPCDPPCQNGGLCVLGRFLEKTCQCHPDFTGPQCQFKKCSDITFSNKKMSKYVDTQAAYTGKIWKVCPEDYIHTSTGNNSYVEICVDGEWVKPEGRCEPICDPSCLNNGTCVEPYVCSCPKETYGHYCQYLSCANAWTPSINRVTFKNNVHQLNLTCEPGYRFRSGATLLTFNCLENGTWGFTSEETEHCLPDCSQFPCFNNGTCVQPNTCKCTAGFTGPQCRTERCPDPPKLVLNAVSSYSDRFYLKYDIKCFTGYELMNHQTFMQVHCENGIWGFPPGFRDSFRISCLPTCDPPCFNGGQCIAPNTCRCPEGFFGEACTKRYEKTLDDNAQCQFPFLYHKKWYFACTTAGYHHLPWCATKVDENFHVRSRSVCVADVGKVRVRQTLSKKICIFPFRFEGSLFYDCIKTFHKDGFCATSVNADLSANITSICTDQNEGSRHVMLTIGGYECTTGYLIGGPYYSKMVEESYSYGLCVIKQHLEIAQKDEMANVVLIDSGYRTNTITTSGKRCLFPFMYEGQNYYTCTDIGHKLPWCPTKLDANGNILESESCLTSFLPGQDKRDQALTNLLTTDSGDFYLGSVRIVVTLTGERCLFPFLYNGTSHYKCIHLGANMPWCATEIDNDGQVIARGFCPRDWDPFEYMKSFLSIYANNNNVPMSVSGHQCVPFKYKGISVSGCIQEDGQEPWCAVVVNNELQASVVDFCIHTHETTLPRASTNLEYLDYINMLYSVHRPGVLDPEEVDNDLLLHTIKGGSCVPFMNNNKMHYGCVDNDEQIPWCAVEVDEQHLITKQGYCPENWQFWRYFLTLELDFWSPFMANLDTTKTTTGKQCVFPFIHKGKLYHQCVEADEENSLSWCATKVDCNGHIILTDYCLPTKDIVVRSSSGKICVPFLENGAMKEGCVYSLTGDQPWCAIRVDSQGQLVETDTCPKNWEQTKIVIPKSRRSKVSSDVQVMKSEEVVYLRAEEGAPCVPFINNNTLVKHCVTDNTDNNSWCAVATDNVGAPIATSVCPLDWQDTVWPKEFPLQKQTPCLPKRKHSIQTITGKDCVFPFVFEGRHYYECVTGRNMKPWCATTVSPSGVALDVGLCFNAKSPLQLGSGRHHNMTITVIQYQLPFLIKSKKYCHCTEVDDIKLSCHQKK